MPGLPVTTRVYGNEIVGVKRHQRQQIGHQGTYNTCVDVQSTLPEVLHRVAEAIIHDSIHNEAVIPTDGIISRTLHSDEHIKVVLFGFDPGQELSEHTASVPATIHILSGDADVVIGDKRQSVAPGFWAWMPANMPHSILARTKTVMLLYMVKAAKSDVAA